MRYRYYESDWDVMLHEEIADEIVNLDKAHKRAKRALRQQQKAINYRNKVIGNLLTKNDELEATICYLEKITDDNIALTKETNSISKEKRKLVAENDKLEEEVKYWKKRYYTQLEGTIDKLDEWLEELL